MYLKQEEEIIILNYLIVKIFNLFTIVILYTIVVHKKEL